MVCVLIRVWCFLFLIVAKSLVSLLHQKEYGSIRLLFCLIILWGQRRVYDGCRCIAFARIEGRINNDYVIIEEIRDEVIHDVH